MLEYKRLTKQRRKFLALTGLTPKEFKMLLPACCEVYESVRSGDTTQSGQMRRRHVGGGRQGQWQAPEQKLLFSLVYQKASPLQTLLGEVFEVSQARVNDWGPALLPLLPHAVAALALRPTREPSPFARPERAQQEPPELILEGTERRRQRPRSPQNQALHSRGKLKTPSDKHVVVVNAKTKRVGDLSQTYAGKTQAKQIADQEPLGSPRDPILYQDTGFQGYEPPVAQTRQPKKSPAKANCPGARSGTIGRCRGCGCGWNTPWRA